MRRLGVSALLTWALLLLAMMANGFVRVLVMEPRLGELLARQVATAFGVAIVIAVAGAFVRRHPEAGARALLEVGALWLLLTVAFELLFGHYVAGASWRDLLHDYNVFEGRFWPLVLFAVVLGPWLWGLARPGDPSPPRRIV